jgi:hypothetical protein
MNTICARISLKIDLNRRRIFLIFERKPLKIDLRDEINFFRIDLNEICSFKIGLNEICSFKNNFLMSQLKLNINVLISLSGVCDKSARTL